MRHTWRVLDFRDSFLTSTLAKQNSRGRSVSEDVTANRLATIRSSKEGAGSRVTLDLVRHKDSDVELCQGLVRPRRKLNIESTFGDMRQLGEELVELLLALIQLTTTSVVNAEECHDAVDDKKAILVTDKEFGDLVQELHLVLRVDSTRIGDIVLSWALLVKSQYDRHNLPVSGSTPKRSAIWAILSGLNVPSVSTKQCQIYLNSDKGRPTNICDFSFCAAHIFRKLCYN